MRRLLMTTLCPIIAGVVYSAEPPERPQAEVLALLVQKISELEKQVLELQVWREQYQSEQIAKQLDRLATDRAHQEHDAQAREQELKDIDVRITADATSREERERLTQRRIELISPSERPDDGNLLRLEEALRNELRRAEYRQQLLRSALSRSTGVKKQLPAN